MSSLTIAFQILDTWARKPLDFDPGTKWQYSNTNYVITSASRDDQVPWGGCQLTAGLLAEA